MATRFCVVGGIASKLMYKDLTMFQWLEGYASIVEKEPDINIARIMLAHFRALMRDAEGHGWEVVRKAHGLVLDNIERGEFFWTDEFKLAECRRSAISHQTTKPQPSQFYSQSTRGNNAPSFSNHNSNNARGSGGGKGKPAVKCCDFFNRGVCMHRGDHRNGNVYWRHVCNVCSSPDHVEKDCSFLQGIM
jgi:hypothetical protein